MHHRKFCAAKSRKRAVDHSLVLRGPFDGSFIAARQSEQIGEPQILYDGVQVDIVERHGRAEQHALPETLEAIGHYTNTRFPGAPRVQRRPVARGSGNGEVIVAPHLPDEAPLTGRRHHDDSIDIRIAGEHAFRAHEYQQIYVRRRPGVLDGSDQRRRQQHVADAPGNDHQHAGRDFSQAKAGVMA